MGNVFKRVKVQYMKEVKAGEVSKVTENYVIKADSFTETESAAYGELAEGTKGDFNVLDICPEKFVSVMKHRDDVAHWYKATCAVVEMQDSGKEKTSKFTVLVEADNISEAEAIIKEANKFYGEDNFRVTQVSETDILEVFDDTSKLYNAVESKRLIPGLFDVNVLAEKNKTSSTQVMDAVEFIEQEAESFKSTAAVEFDESEPETERVKEGSGFEIPEEEGSEEVF